MAIRLPPLSGLRLFEAAARCGSFKQAAHELNLTPGALSHGIDALERWLDVELFERKAHRTVLSAAGRQYLPYVSEALSTIATGTLRLPSRGSEHRLSISSFGIFAYKMLLPRLHKFREIHPDVVVSVDVSRKIVQLPSDQFDVAIRSSCDAWPKLSCDLLTRVGVVPVGSPGYVRDLLRGGDLDWSLATLIHTPNVSDDWETWCHHSRADISSARKIRVSNVQFAHEAAADGLGLAIGRLPMIDNDIATGRLVIAVDHVVPVMLNYWLVKPPGLETRRVIAAFRDWLLKETSQLGWHGYSEEAAAARSA